MDEIRLRRQGQVAVVTLNRPEKKNCCTKAMWFELGRLFGELDKDGDVRAIVLTGAGENFCTGADISEFAEVRGDADQAADYARAVIAAEHGIAEVTKPVIAAVRGYAVGGGCGLIVCADFRVSDRSGRFGVPAARLSIVYGMDGLQKLANVVGVTNAKKIMYTARRFTAEEAADMGLVDMLVDGDPVEAAIEFAESMAGNAPLSVMGHKIGLNAVAAGRMAETEDSYRDLQMQASESEDYREGRAAFMEKRAPVFQGR
ncbi:MAG: enoyl-CoA hydratase-related protein [Alphaproteobacteria bacterium]|nr:enoyl-CoA hydratase-related protein [Alphaproteobacteria bacterium]